jgi:hypothetical protein
MASSPGLHFETSSRRNRELLEIQIWFPEISEALVIVSCLSLTAVIGLLLAISLSVRAVVLI